MCIFVNLKLRRFRYEFSCCSWILDLDWLLRFVNSVSTSFSFGPGMRRACYVAVTVTLLDQKSVVDN